MRQSTSSGYWLILIVGLFLLLVALAAMNNFSNRALAAYYPTENIVFASSIRPE